MQKPNALDGISETERRAMLALIHMKPEQQKSSPKVETPQGRAQRRRRERERRAANHQATSSD